MAAPANVPKLALSVAEVAEAIGLGKSKTYELVNKGIIPSIGIGAKRVVPVKLLEEFLERQPVRRKDA